MLFRKTSLDVNIKNNPTYPIDNLSVWGFDILNVNILNDKMYIDYNFHSNNISLKINHYKKENYAIVYMIKHSGFTNSNQKNKSLIINLTDINYFTFVGYIAKFKLNSKNNSKNNYYNIKSLIGNIYSYSYTYFNNDKDNFNIDDFIEDLPYDDDDLLRRQMIYHKFNLKLSLFSITLDIFIEKSNHYYIKCSTTINKKLILSKIIDNVVYFYLVNDNNDNNNDNQNKILSFDFSADVVDLEIILDNNIDNNDNNPEFFINLDDEPNELDIL